jgi:hypothetical protein
MSALSGVTKFVINGDRCPVREGEGPRGYPAEPRRALARRPPEASNHVIQGFRRTPT